MHHGLFLALWGGCMIELSSAAGGTVSPYIDPTQFTATPWGYKSHYTQPWRAWASTVRRTLAEPSEHPLFGRFTCEMSIS